MITGRQIRAARGLLEWTSADLARKAGLTRVTVSKVETDLVTPQEKTLTKILALFDRNGVEFTEDEGVKMRKQQMRIYSGKVGYRQILDHIYDTLKEEGGRIRQFNFPDNRYLPYSDDFVSTHIERMTKIKNLDAKVLTIEGETNLKVPYCEYRTLDKMYKVMAPYYIYGDYLAMSLTELGQKREFISLHSKLLTSRYLEEFDLFWKMAAELKKKK